jgi:hypothetical protein
LREIVITLCPGSSKNPGRHCRQNDFDRAILAVESAQ